MHWYGCCVKLYGNHKCLANIWHWFYDTILITAYRVLIHRAQWLIYEKGFTDSYYITKMFSLKLEVIGLIPLSKKRYGAISIYIDTYHLRKLDSFYGTPPLREESTFEASIKYTVILTQNSLILIIQKYISNRAQSIIDSHSKTRRCYNIWSDSYTKYVVQILIEIATYRMKLVETKYRSLKYIIKYNAIWHRNAVILFNK